MERKGDVRLISLVKEWTRNITRAVSEEQDSIRDDFLSMSYMPSLH